MQTKKTFVSKCLLSRFILIGEKSSRWFPPLAQVLLYICFLCILCVFQNIINFSTDSALIQMHTLCNLLLCHRLPTIDKQLPEDTVCQTIRYCIHKLLHRFTLLLQCFLPLQITILQSLVFLLVKPNHTLWHRITFAVIKYYIIPDHRI